jgi:alpha-mannosidase
MSNTISRYYKELDKLIKYVNADGKMHLFYSSVENYVEAKQKEVKEKGISFPAKYGDFFPYADAAEQ